MNAFLRSLLGHYRIFIPAAVLFFATSVFLLLHSDIFLVRHFQLEAKTDYRLLSKDALLEQLSTYLARSLLIINTHSVEQKLVQSNLALASAKVQKHFPDTLQVTYWEHEPVAVIRLNFSSSNAAGAQGKESYFLVNQAGLLFALAPERYKLSLPHLTLVKDKGSGGEENYKLGTRISSGLVSAALQVLEGVGRLDNAQLKELVVHSQGELTLLSQSGWQAFLDAGKDTGEQIAALSAILSDAGEKGRRLKRIDLRFKRPVVVYN